MKVVSNERFWCSKIQNVKMQFLKKLQSDDSPKPKPLNYIDFGHGPEHELHEYSEWMILTAVFVMMVAHGLASGPITWVYFTDILPDFGVALCMSIKWAFNILQAFLESLDADNIITFSIFAGTTFLGTGNDLLSLTGVSWKCVPHVFRVIAIFFFVLMSFKTNPLSLRSTSVCRIR